MKPGHRRAGAAGRVDDFDGARARSHRADDDAGRLGVGPEHAERIAVAAGGKGLQVVEGERGSGHRGAPGSYRGAGGVGRVAIISG